MDNATEESIMDIIGKLKKIDYINPEDIPNIDLYMDQVIALMEKYLSDLTTQDDSKLITPSMINNYVKQEVLKPPVKKKYNKTHLAYLFVICILKRLMSISEINESIKSMQKTYSVEDGYNVFCEELEKALKNAFNPEIETPPMFTESDTREYATLKAIVAAFADCILVDRLILLRK